VIEDMADEKDKNAQDVTEEETEGSASDAYVVGVGASAGGLDAYTELFRDMPADSGLIFVLVPHLDPKHATQLPELLQRSTEMRVKQIEEGEEARRNTIYVIPPDKDLGLMDGRFQLIERQEGKRRLPINYFFRALAHDRRDRAIAVILSGTGSDGAVGLRAIKENLGMVMVQDPNTAKYAGMPESAIDTGMADYVLSVGDMPQRLINYVENGQRRERLDGRTLTRDVSQALRKIFYLLRSETGHDFSAYKRNTILRRIDRRLNVHHIDDISAYVKLLQSDRREMSALFKDMLIGVTNFFRDEEAFEALKAALGSLLTKNKGEFRAWVPGTATGEEAYSVAMILSELLAEKQLGVDVQIFATDISDDSIEKARAGIFSAGIADDVGKRRLERFFVREDNTYRIDREIREMVIFANQDVIKDPPFTRLDLVCCRNLLIYLDGELQKRLLPAFHYALRPGGILFLGSSESIGEFTELFETVDSRWKLFRAKQTSTTYHPVLDLAHVGDRREPERARGAQKQTTIEQISRMLLETYLPPCVVVDSQGEIKHIHGRTGKYLEPASGRPTMNINDMAREGLRLFLPNAIRKAKESREEVRHTNIKVKHNDSSSRIDVIVQPLQGSGDDTDLLLVAFEQTGERDRQADAADRDHATEEQPEYVERLETELHYTRDNLQSTIEELETSNEELRSMNEEYQSTNEELKSANEELETSREELQSLNEELSTVNSELQEKISDLSRSSVVMQRYLDSLEIPTIFLDNKLRIRRFTEQASLVVNLVEADIGRPLSHITTKVEDEFLIDDAKRVLDTLQRSEKEIRVEDGRWYLRRIIPYKSPENLIDGVVISFVDIDLLKERTAQMIAAEQARNMAEAVVETLRDPLLVLDPDLRVVTANSAFMQMFRLGSDEVKGRILYEIGDGSFDIAELRKQLGEIVPQQRSFDGFEVEHDFARVGHKKLVLNARRLMHEESQVELLLLGMEEVGE
jgi:two-component system CheB/CheR fusion protein